MYINDIWNLFKMTGKIEYYLKYKEIVKYEKDNYWKSF